MAEALTPIYGEVIEVTDRTFPEDVTATIEVGEERTETVTGDPADVLVALVDVLYGLERKSGKPKKRGRKTAGGDPIDDVLNRQRPIAQEVINGASLSITVKSGPSDALVLRARGRCAMFAALVCEVGSVVKIQPVDVGDDLHEAAEISIMEGRNAGESSETFFADDEVQNTEPEEDDDDEDDESTLAAE